MNTTTHSHRILELADESEVATRLAVALDAHREFTKYAAHLSGRHAGNWTSHFRTAADRAFEAEANFRVTVKAAVDSLNELRTSGFLYEAMQTLHHVAREPAALDSQLEAARRMLAQHGLHPELLDEAVARFREADVKLHARGEHVGISAKTGGGKRIEEIFAVSPLPNQIARITARDLLGQDVPRVVPVWAPAAPSCHHSREVPAIPRVAPTVPHLHDPYAALVAATMYCQQLMYRHAREMEALGPSPLTGGDYGAGLIGIIVVAIICALLVSTGVVLAIICGAGGGGGDVCLASKILIGLGLSLGLVVCGAVTEGLCFLATPAVIGVDVALAKS